MALLIFQVICLLTFPAAYMASENDAGFIAGLFEIDSCADSGMDAILRAIPSKTVTSFSTLECALFCQRNSMCMYAIFYSLNNSCEQIHGLTNTFRNVNEDYLVKDSNVVETAIVCKVLRRVVAELWTTFRFSEIFMLETIDNYSHLKVQMLKTHLTRINELSQQTVNPSGKFMIASEPKSMAITFRPGPDPVFANTYRSKMVYMYGKPSDMKGLDAKIYVQSTPTPYFSAIDIGQYRLMRKNTNMKTSIYLANNLNELILSVLRGYRRFERKPTRLYVDAVGRQVYFDITESIQEELSTNSPTSPLFFTSIKESVTHKKRYILKHEIFGKQKLPYEEEAVQSTYPWVFDTSWRRINGDKKSQVEEIRKAILEGKPATLLLNSKISTDIIMTCLVPGQVLVALTPFISPFKGEESVHENVHEIHFPVFHIPQDQELSCASSFVNGGGPLRVVGPVYQNSAWFVSTKTWTKLYEFNDELVVIYGTLQSLKQAVEVGKDIRVCVEFSDDFFYCFNSPQLVSRHESDDVLLQSYPFVSPLDVYNGDHKNCSSQIVMLVSSQGWIDVIQFSVGSATAPANRMPFILMSWFAQQN